MKGSDEYIERLYVKGDVSGKEWSLSSGYFVSHLAEAKPCRLVHPFVVRYTILQCLT